jgi:hypothetical protein
MTMIDTQDDKAYADFSMKGHDTLGLSKDQRTAHNQLATNTVGRKLVNKLVIPGKTGKSFTVAQG